MANSWRNTEDVTDEMRGTRNGFASWAAGWAVSAMATLASIASVWHFSF